MEQVRQANGANRLNDIPRAVAKFEGIIHQKFYWFQINNLSHD